MPKETLLDLDRVPTLEELREFFRKNDWSTATYKEIDYDKMDADEIENMEYIKGLMDEHFEPLAREMGLKSHSGYYGNENPLVAMRDNTENLVATGVLKLIEEQPEKVDQILSHFFTDEAMENPEQFEKNVDNFLHNAIETTMKTLQFEEIAGVLNKSPAYEDFNHDKNNNLRAADFDRKWNHTRAAVKTTSLEELQEKCYENSDKSEEIFADVMLDIPEEVEAKTNAELFWNEISDEDKSLLQMKMDGLTQKEIAEKLGYKTHSAIGKRLQKLKDKFMEISA